MTTNGPRSESRKIAEGTCSSKCGSYNRISASNGRPPSQTPCLRTSEEYGRSAAHCAAPRQIRASSQKCNFALDLPAFCRHMTPTAGALSRTNSATGIGGAGVDKPRIRGLYKHPRGEALLFMSGLAFEALTDPEFVKLPITRKGTTSMLLRDTGVFMGAPAPGLFDK